MPIFEYICKQCSVKFEAIVMGSSEYIKCPECGNDEISKVPSAFSLSGGVRLSSQASSCSSCIPNPSKCSSCR